MKKFLLLIISIPLFAAAVVAQSTIIKGKVTDSSGTGLKGINVVAKGVTKGTQTDADGNFSITVNSTNAPLTFSSVGYKSRTINASQNISVILVRDVQMQEEVVVNVGYGSIKRRQLSSSVSSITAKDLKDVPINSAAEALNGRLAGVTATTSEGSPDADIRVRIRGGMSITQDNSPLYIIDGIQVENGLSTISPQDIQTIDVLKDAAATAIYGARGANGVIVISTKSGKPGKLRVNYSGFAGVKYLPSTLEVLSPYDFVLYAYERSRGSADSVTFAKDFGTTWDTLAVYKNVPAVNWQDKVMGQTGVTQTHNIGLNGGNNKATYNFSYTNNNDKAIILNSKYQRNLLNLKGDYKITKKIKLTGGARYTLQDVYGAGVSSDAGTSFNRLRNAIKYRPFLSAGQNIDDNDPYADPNVGNSLSLVNPLQLASAEYRKKTTEAYNLNASISYNITKKISFKSTVGYDRNELKDRQFSDSITSYGTTQGGKKPIISLDTTTKKTLTNSNVFTYSLKNFHQKHDFDVLVGEETYQLETETRGRTVKDFATFTNPIKAFNTYTTGTIVGLPRLYKSKYTNISFFSRVNYTYDDKYIFSFNVRADGASKFIEGNKWGYFPAGSVAWRVKKEKFMENVNFINDFKIRGGFGTVGNNRIADYLFLTTFRNDQYFYGLNGQTVPAYNSTSLVNEKLKWESTLSRNIGFDITVLRNRLDFSFDYYNNSSRNLLLNIPIASTYGYATQLQNVGTTSSKGVELQLSAVILKSKKNLNWNANFNMSFNRSTVGSLGYLTSFQPDASWGVSGQPKDYIVKPGIPVGSMYGWVSDGFYTLNDFNRDATTGMYTLKTGVADMYKITGGAVPGGIKYKDISGPAGVPDGIVNEFDKTIIGNPTPKFTGGLTQSFSYRQWDASVFVNFSYGNDIYNANKIELTNGYSNNSNMLAITKDRWRITDANGKVLQTTQNLTINGESKTYAFSAFPDQLAAANVNAKFWQPVVGNGAFYPNSWAIEDGSFLRLNNITVGYTLPVKTLVKYKISKVRLYVTGNNIAVLTSYSGYDPEVSVRSNPLTPGLDYSAYPKSRSFIFGLNVSF